MPVLLYGAAHSGGQRLADIRRACGYFTGARDGNAPSFVLFLSCSPGSAVCMLPSGRGLICHHCGYQQQQTCFSTSIWAALPFAGRFKGSADVQLPASLVPGYGPRVVDPCRGIATVGAVPWVVNYNVLLDTGDMALARRIARAVSSRGGGVACVEAMALPHTAGESACCFVVY